MDTGYEVIIVGAGPAGLTAGLYISRAGLRTLILDKGTLGGELMNRDLIENYPSYPDGILGPDLGSNMAQQAMNYGVEIQFAEAKQIEIVGDYKVVKTSAGNFRGRAVVIAGGAQPRKLGIPGEQQFADNGVIYCATCDGPRFADKVVAVTGGGDSGVTEALFLTRIVSKVMLIEVLPRLSATRILRERVSSNPKIEIKCGVRIEAIHGKEQVEAIEISDTQTGQRSLFTVDGILVHVGLEANIDYLKGTLPLNKRGQILVNQKMETEVAGIFAAGDVRHNSPMQVVTAVGDGATAALSLEKYLGTR